MNLAYNEGWHAFQRHLAYHQDIQQQEKTIKTTKQRMQEIPCVVNFCNGWYAAYKLYLIWKE